MRINIELEFSSLVVGNIPDYVTVGDLEQDNSFTVHYTNGTSAEYNTVGSFGSIVAIDCPGYLTFTGTGQRQYQRTAYIYSYTEAGVTTSTFDLHWYYGGNTD